MTDSLLPQKRPDLVPTADQLDSYGQTFKAVYRDYTTHVSPFTMAMSYEACTYIAWLAATTGARTAIDFGSGFTSYLLRVFCEEVTSVDDSASWLTWTQRFLERYMLDKGQTVVFDDYEPGEYDLVVYDFGCGQFRDDHFVDGLAALAPGGVAVLDDAMHTEHANSMRRAAKAFGYDLYSLKEWTTDEMGRFCALAIRP